MAALPEYVDPSRAYLERERQAEEKSEFIDGEIIAMAGAGPAHVAIVWNVTGLLFNALRGRECRGATSDQRVKIQETRSYTYPDVVVVCGEPRYENGQPDVLLNPTLIMEVLSPSTETYDLGLKLAHYRRLDSLREFVALAQDRVYAQHWIRQPKGLWLVEDITDIAAVLSLASIDCNLPLADVYDRVDLLNGGGADGSNGTATDSGCVGLRARRHVDAG